MFEMINQSVVSPFSAKFSQNASHRLLVRLRARSVSTPSEPDRFHFIPDPHILDLTTVLQAASVIPEPIGSFVFL